MANNLHFSTFKFIDYPRDPSAWATSRLNPELEAIDNSRDLNQYFSKDQMIECSWEWVAFFLRWARFGLGGNKRSAPELGEFHMIKFFVITVLFGESELGFESMAIAEGELAVRAAPMNPTSAPTSLGRCLGCYPAGAFSEWLAEQLSWTMPRLHTVSSHI